MLKTCAPRLASTHDKNAIADRVAQIKAQIAGAGAFGQQGEGFPEFEVGPAWRIDLVFMELHHAVGERRRAPGRSEDEVGLPQCP